MEFSKKLLNQTVLITGASSGIGEACAEQFAAHGANLILTARRLDRLKTLSTKLEADYNIRCDAFPLDVRKNEEVEELFKMLPPIDILINNAGLALAMDKIQDSNIENWEQMIDTNVKGLLYVTKYALPNMIKRDKGHIINIGSISGLELYPKGNVYCATKHAVNALSRSLMLDLIGTNLRVTEIDPGAVNTEFSTVRFNDKERADQFYQGFEPLVASDIADTVLFAATRPPHVNISQIVVLPQAQASVRDLHRKQ